MDGAADRPSGTVTCLFTDIEGSTRLELDIGTGPYRTIRERHRELLRAAFSSHFGHEQGTEGDSFFVIFPRATDAVAAAVAGQRALAAEPWPDGIAVRVRMGLHTGDVERVGDDVIGHAINRAARISAAAHGGQVLVSRATRALVEDVLPAGVTWRDLGEHRLKDLREPERLSQLVIEGLDDRFPPPRTLDARPNNLPTQLTSFIGREREVAEVGALLDGARLVSLIGPGGTGKTRLSLQVAADVAERFPDGVWFVALDAVRDPALVVATVARTMGLAEIGARSALDVVADAVGAGAVLLVLDNVEQVVDAGPDIAELLRRCPNLRVLVTTRIALRVSGEQQYPVPGLPAPPDPSRLSAMDRQNLAPELREADPATIGSFEAVRLFVTRAAAIRPGFAVTAANAAAVSAIAARLHGMPLAIELAAARIKLLSPDQILGRLDHHLAVLSAGSRDLPERQQTLRGAIAWSYELLDDGAKLLLDRLSTFRGGFTLELAETVCGPASDIGGDIVERIGELVDQSLIRHDRDTADDGDPDVEPRCAMLETIREYAAEMLEARGETDALARRHATAVLAIAEAAVPHLRGPEQRRWLDRLEREHDNIRAAIEWATDRPVPDLAVRLGVASWRFWQQRGYLKEARARLERMAEQGWDLEPLDRAHFAEALGGVVYWQSDHAAAVRWYDEALAIHERLGDRAEIANALYNRAYADMVALMDRTASRKDLEHGRELMERGLALYRELGDTGGEGNLLWGLGSFEFFTGAPAAAEGWYRRSLDLHRAAGDHTMEAWSLHMLALAQAGQRHWAEAGTNARHALRHFRDAGDIAGVTLVLDDLALVAVADGDEERAGRLWGAARRLQSATGAAVGDYIDTNKDLLGVATPPDVIEPARLEQFAAEGSAMGLDELVDYALAGDDGGLHEPHPEAP
ncbi:MAG: ATP-binding protein [Candidatus Limnocylindria bacterium]